MAKMGKGRDVGDGVDRLSIGAINPIRVHATLCVQQKLLSDGRAAQVVSWLRAPSLKWSEWNALKDWVADLRPVVPPVNGNIQSDESRASDEALMAEMALRAQEAMAHQAGFSKAG